MPVKIIKIAAILICGAIVLAAMSCVQNTINGKVENEPPTAIVEPVSPTDAPEVTTTEQTEETQPTSTAESTAASETTTSSAESITTQTASTTSTTTAQSTATRTTTTRQTTTTARPTTTTTRQPTTTTTTRQTTTTTRTTTAAPTTTTTTAAAFDINRYIAYAKSYGQSIGMAYDEGVSSYDTPLILSSATSDPEGRIRDRLNGYAADGCTAFKVWAEYRASDGKWKLYIAYG